MAKPHTAILIGLLAALSLTAVPAVVAQDPETLDPELAGLVRAVAEAKTPEDASKALVKLFKGADRKKLERLKQVKEDGVALRAAWEEVLMTLPEEAQESLVHPDRLQLSRFVGFLEGRLRLAVPSWWEKSLVGVTGYNRDRTGFPQSKELKVQRTASGYWVSGGLKLDHEKGSGVF